MPSTMPQQQKGFIMLKMCSYCNTIHQEDYMCSSKSETIKSRANRTEKDRLRGLSVWKKKREEIKKRDNYLCQACFNALDNRGEKRINIREIQVHHIIPMDVDVSKWLKNNNLICLCKYHHERAEKEIISKKELLKIIPPLKK